MTTAIPPIEEDRNRRRRWSGGGRALLIYAFLSEVIVVLQDKRVRSRSQEIRAKEAPARGPRANDASGASATNEEVGSRGTRGRCPF